MFDPFTLALIGGALGGLTNKKDPLQGALLGAAGGYGGGALMGGGGLLGGAQQAAAPVVDAAITPVAESAVTPMASEAMHPWAAQFQQSVNTPASGGLLQPPAPVVNAAINPVSSTSQFMAKAKEFGGAVKPYSDAIGTGVSVANMFKQDEHPIVASPVMQPAGPNMPMNNLMQNINNMQAQRLQEEQQRRMRRKSLLGG